MNQTMGADSLVRCHSEWNAIKTLEVLLYQNFPLTFNLMDNKIILGNLRRDLSLITLLRFAIYILLVLGVRQLWKRKVKYVVNDKACTVIG